MVEYFHPDTHLGVGREKKEGKPGDKAVLPILSWNVLAPLKTDAHLW